MHQSVYLDAACLAVDRHQMNPDGSIQMYMPNEIKLQATAQQVTPRELANHMSGMPENRPGLPRQLEMRSIEFYTSTNFLHWVSNWSPDGALPAPYLYSNAASGPSDIWWPRRHTRRGSSSSINRSLSHLAGSTQKIRPNVAQMQHMAMGHRLSGMPAPAWPVYAWYPAGAPLHTSGHAQLW